MTTDELLREAARLLASPAHKSCDELFCYASAVMDWLAAYEAHKAGAPGHAGLAAVAADDGWNWQVETYFTPWCKFEEDGKECGESYAGNNGDPPQSEVRKMAEAAGWRDGLCPKHAARGKDGR